MKQENEITQELNALGSTLAAFPRTMPYAVPDGYFRGINAAVRAHIAYEVDPQIAFSKEMPYVVPENYFATFPGDILRWVQAEHTHVPVSTPFQVPVGYFQQLPEQMLTAVKEARVQPAPAATRVVPWRRVLGSGALRYAVAAMLLVVVGIGLFRLTMAPDSTQVAQKLAQIPKDEVRSYILQHIDEFETEELLAGLQTGHLNQQPFVPTPRISDEEIIRYLDETGWNTEL